MSDFWNEWGEKTTGPLPPGEYTVRVDQVAMSYGIDGTPKTEFTLVVADGQPHARRLIWEKWSHKPTQGWKLRRMWEACGMQGRPPGDNPEQVFTNAAQVLSDHAPGKVFKIVTANRTYQNNQGGQSTATDVKSVSPVQAAPPVVAPGAPAQAQGEAPYGGRPDAPQW